jgi:hypothetical protein
MKGSITGTSNFTAQRFFLIIRAHFRRKRRKPGYPLQFRRLTSGKPAEFRFYPLRAPKPALFPAKSAALCRVLEAFSVEIFRALGVCYITG